MYLKTFVILMVTATAIAKTYNGYKVYNVLPKNDVGVKVINDVQSSGLGELWEDHVSVGQVNKIMVAKDKQKTFVNGMKNAGVEVSEVISDLQQAINDQRKPSLVRNSESFLSLNWTEYHDLETIDNWLDEVAAAYPSIVTPITIGQSVENRDIKGIIINFHPGVEKPIGVIEGTIHAREWISPATVTWIIKEFLTSTDARVRSMAESIEWHVVPVLNPDGYSYTFTTNRMWRKNRSRASFTTCATDDDMSNGVDLNRNFDFVWMTESASSNPCDNTFAGTAPFSEPEARAMADHVTSLDERGDILYYFAFHSYTQLIIVPYSNIQNLNDGGLPDNYADLYEISANAADVLAQRYGTVYRYGLSTDLMYAMSGTSFDWAKYHANATISYLFELRDVGEFGFLLRPESIIPNNLEIIDALIEMDRKTQELGYYTGSAVKTAALSSALLAGLIAALIF